MQNNNSAKIVVLGDLGTGKSTLLKHHLYKQQFNHFYKITSGVSILKKTYNSNKIDLSEGVRQAFGPGEPIELEFWDIAGPERFGNDTSQYYKDAEAAIITIDVTRIGTLEGAQRWKSDLEAKKIPGRMIPTFIVATKSDSATDESWSHIDASFPGIGIYRTSAKSGNGLDALFNDIAKEVITNRVNQALIIAKEVINHLINQPLINDVENHCKTQQTDYQFDYSKWPARQLLTLLIDMQLKQTSANAASFFQSGVNKELWQNAISEVQSAVITALSNENTEKYQGKIVLDDDLYQRAYELLSIHSNSSVNRSLPAGAGQFADTFGKRSTLALEESRPRP